MVGCPAPAGGAVTPPFTVSGLLFGGSGGGAGFRQSGDPTTPGGRGGAGGGALLIGANGPAVIAGTIDAGGCGGQKAFWYGYHLSAGGGGAGGLIVVEAPTIELKVGARLVANGGGGGGGTVSFADSALNGPGADAIASDAAASGGVVPTGPLGGTGGAIAAPGSVAAHNRPWGTSVFTSAGGGAAGRIVVKTRTGTASISGAVVSPTPEAATVASK
jgi:hypothetical protein